MGQFLSNTRNEEADIVEPPPTRPSISFRADYLPDEVSRRPEDLKDWYTDFFEQAFVAPHRDGRSVVVFWPYPNREVRVDEPDPKDIIANAATIYESLFFKHGGHPRMVKYLHRLDDGIGFCLERLTPGPLDNIRFPPLSLPISTPSTQNRMLLALYYRWALQSLSALHFMHTKSLYLATVGNTFTWLRSDMSIAITGLTCVASPTLVPEWDDHGETDPASWPEFTSHVQFLRYEEEKHRQGAWQELEEERLGPILVKAWNQEYQSAEQVMQDVQEVVKKVGMKLIGEDEVELEEVTRTCEGISDQELQSESLEKEIS
ncbi:hypothetical protein McanMca71_005287 [Microsporum canis]